MCVITGSLQQTTEAASLCESLDMNDSCLKQFKYFVSSAAANFTGSKSRVVSRPRHPGSASRELSEHSGFTFTGPSSELESAQQQYHTASRKVPTSPKNKHT